MYILHFLVLKNFYSIFVSKVATVFHFLWPSWRHCIVMKTIVAPIGWFNFNQSKLRWRHAYIFLTRSKFEAVVELVAKTSCFRYDRDVFVTHLFIEYVLYIHKHDNVNWMKKDMVDSLVSTHWKIQSEMLLLSKQWTKNTQLCWCELMVVATFKCRVKECFRLWKTFWWTSTEIDGIHELNPVPTNPTKRFTDLVS